MQIHFYNLKTIDKDNWDDGIVNPSQLFAFACTQLSKFRKPVFLFIKFEGILFKWQFYVVGFPLFRYIEIISEPNFQHERILDLAFSAIIDRFQPFEIRFLSITLSKFNNRSFLVKQKFDLIYDYGSHEIDLTPCSDRIFAMIDSKHRNVIRKAKKEGVVIQEDSSEAGLRNFHKVSVDTYSRSGMEGLSMDYLTRIFHSLCSSKCIRIFFAKKDQAIQAGAIFLISRKMSIYFHGASINSPCAGSANLLQWIVMDVFKEEGLERFDFGGFSLEENNEKAQSISRFKQKFGGSPNVYCGGWKILNNFKSKIFRGLNEYAGKNSKKI